MDNCNHKIKTILALSVFAASSLTAYSQVIINSEGKIQLGETIKYQSGQKRVDPQFIPGILNTQTREATQNIVLGTDSVKCDGNAAMVVLGDGINNSKGYIAFGDSDYVGVGEYAGYDSDIIALVGAGGIVYSNGRSAFTKSGSTVFSWKPSTTSGAENFFIFNTDIKAKGVVLTSDMRLKKDMSEIENSALSLEGITPVQYRLESPEQYGDDMVATKSSANTKSEQEKDARLRYGFVAQEVREIFPDLVVEDEEGYLAVDYIGFIPVLVDAVKSLTARVSEQEETIEALTHQGSLRKSPGQSGVESLSMESIVLKQNRPNPFSSSTVIEYSLPQEVAVATLYIYDLRGSQIKSIPLSERGDSSVIIDGSSLQPGMYIYKLVADGVEADSKRMILTD